MAENDGQPRKPIPNPLSKEQRARDAAQAMQEYEAEKNATQAKTARLREMRLAREAEIAANPPPPKTPAKRKKKT